MAILSISALAVQSLFDACVKIAPEYHVEAQPDEHTATEDVLYRDLKDTHSRFKVWCGNLGVYQWGHASLDWRLREALQLHTQIVDLLDHIKDDLENCLEILTRRRPPIDFDSDDSDSDGIDTQFSGSELNVRVQSVTSVVQNLYRVAFVVRSQKTRRKATNKVRDQERRDPESGLDLFEDGYRPFDDQHVRRMLFDMRRVSNPATTESESQYKVLIEHLTTANILRRKQFNHWERHALKLQQIVKPQPIDSEQTEKDDAAAKSTPDTRPLPQGSESGENLKQASALSPTEITKTHREDAQVIEIGADIDAQSVSSCASTVKDIEGHEASLPDPPRLAQTGHAFECPYCFVLCPTKEASRKRWRKHILEDLRPYLCTYAECITEVRLYGSRTDLLNHEETHHRRVWKCRDHPTEQFRSESEFRSHLSTVHRNLDKETVDGLVEFSSTAREDDRQHCPLCLRATSSIPPGQTLFKHIANHLESLSTFSVPRNIDLTNDKKGGSNEPVQQDDDDDHSWFSDVFSEWADDAQAADAHFEGTDGVKLSLEHFPNYEPGSTDMVNEYLSTMEQSTLDNDGSLPVDHADSVDPLTDLQMADGHDGVPVELHNSLASEYFDRMGELRILNEWLQDLDIERREERERRKFLVDQLEPGRELEETEIEIRRRFEANREQILVEIAAAENDTDRLKQECTDAGIELEQYLPEDQRQRYTISNVTTSHGDPLLEDYFDKAGDVGVAKERLSELYKEHEYMRTTRHSQREQGIALPVSDAAFETSCELEAEMARQQVQDATALMQAAKQACLDNSIDPNLYRGANDGLSSPFVSELAPSEPRDPLAYQYYERRGDMMIGKERLQELDFEYREEQAHREMLLDKGHELEVTDSEFHRQYEDRRRQLTTDIATADQDVERLRQECIDAGIELEPGPMSNATQSDHAVEPAIGEQPKVTYVVPGRRDKVLAPNSEAESTWLIAGVPSEATEAGFNLTPMQHRRQVRQWLDDVVADPEISENLGALDSTTFEETPG